MAADVFLSDIEKNPRIGNPYPQLLSIGQASEYNRRRYYPCSLPISTNNRWGGQWSCLSRCRLFPRPTLTFRANVKRSDAFTASGESIVLADERRSHVHTSYLPADFRRSSSSLCSLSNFPGETLVVMTAPEHFRECNYGAAILPLFAAVTITAIATMAATQPTSITLLPSNGDGPPRKNRGTHGRPSSDRWKRAPPLQNLQRSPSGLATFSPRISCRRGSGYPTCLGQMPPSIRGGRSIPDSARPDLPISSQLSVGGKRRMKQRTYGFDIIERLSQMGRDFLLTQRRNARLICRRYPTLAIRGEYADVLWQEALTQIGAGWLFPGPPPHPPTIRRIRFNYQSGCGERKRGLFACDDLKYGLVNRCCATDTPIKPPPGFTSGSFAWVSVARIGFEHLQGGSRGAL